MNRLTLAQKLMYASGYMGIILINTTLMWAMYFYAPPGGSLTSLLPIKLFGLVMLGGRIFDALTDSLVGHWSDRARTRWGRRTPFIVFASLPLFISFVLIWAPPTGEASVLNFVW
ncbi:MFS transporter, partial [Candidatus Aerophobetes bacterium]|nr:MFS transporter [Candidatus Aerophobetes bacterium]